MIFFERPGCAADKITQVLVDHGYAAWPMDPTEQPGHVVLGLRGEALSNGHVSFTLELRGRSSNALLARSRHVIRQDLNIDDLGRREAHQMIADVVRSPAFERVALKVDDDVVSRYSIERPDLSSCRR
jgi:hypothetical protein